MNIRPSLAALLTLLVMTSVVHSQAKPKTDLDKTIESGLEALSDKKWTAARGAFENALLQITKEPEASEYLITRLELPDEAPGGDVPHSKDEASLINYRHGMGTRQALLAFLAFTAELEGNRSLGKKYLDETYRLQGPLWGTSWRVFVPQILALFHLTIPHEKNEFYGRYLFTSGSLLWDAHVEDGKKLIEEAHLIRPKDAEIAAKLGSIYMILQDPAKAKPQSELSLSIDPKQPHVLIDLSTANWLLGNFDDAAKEAETASTIDPNLPGPYMLVAIVALQKGDFEKSASRIEKAIELSHQHPFYLTVKAALFEAQGDQRSADELVQKAWKNEIPPIEQFERWYLKHKPLELVAKILKRQRRN